MFEAGRTKGVLMNKSRQLRPVIVGVLVALVWMSGKASAAQCGSTAAGFEAWKRQFTGEAQARGVSASAIAALMGTTIRLQRSRLTAVRGALVCRSIGFL